MGKKNDKPAEISAKKPVSRFRNVIETKRKFVDPRFNDLCGELRPEIFNTAYAFIDEYKKDDLATLNEAYQKEQDEDRKEELRLYIQKERDAISRREHRLLVDKKISAAKKQELSAVRQGKTPYYLKKSKIRELELEAKYDQLKSKGRLSSYLEKRRKSNASKDRRWLPRKSTLK
jgi:ribosomal RNA-processing protein 36